MSFKARPKRSFEQPLELSGLSRFHNLGGVFQARQLFTLDDFAPVVLADAVFGVTLARFTRSRFVFLSFNKN